MRIRVSKVAMSNGKPRAFTIKIKGKKFPREHRGFYFTDSKEMAIALAWEDYLDLKYPRDKL
jgi:hypothetical protein|tara:strand:- start:45 stop:230 length:186 start_codon:yes stop_codon:yes gene_type:complete